MRLLVLLAMRLHIGPYASQAAGDGCGSCWPRYCRECGRQVQVVRPGMA